MWSNRGMWGLSMWAYGMWDIRSGGVQRMLDPTSVVEGLKVGYGGSMDVVIQGYVGFEHGGIWDVGYKEWRGAEDVGPNKCSRGPKSGVWRFYGCGQTGVCGV